MHYVKTPTARGSYLVMLASESSPYKSGSNSTALKVSFTSPQLFPCKYLRPNVGCEDKSQFRSTCAAKWSGKPTLRSAAPLFDIVDCINNASSSWGVAGKLLDGRTMSRHRPRPFSEWGVLPKAAFIVACIRLPTGNECLWSFDRGSPAHFLCFSQQVLLYITGTIFASLKFSGNLRKNLHCSTVGVDFYSAYRLLGRRAVSPSKAGIAFWIISTSIA